VGTRFAGQATLVGGEEAGDGISARVNRTTQTFVRENYQLTSVY
jgi:hypothetical protein